MECNEINKVVNTKFVKGILTDTCYVGGILAKSDKFTGYLFYDTIL